MNGFPIIRDLHQTEISFLDEMLYEAIFIPEGLEKLPKEIINQPDLLRYIKNFGRVGDICMVADLQGKLIGAIWTRIFTKNEKGYGYVDAETPELSMAIFEQYRHRGIGTLLLNEMIRKLRDQNYKQISLSVDKKNYAFDFYKRNGFEIFSSTEKSATLIKYLKEQWQRLTRCKNNCQV
jgi:ribosomal protein S18 acetylase RimI-like enzyme